eukprot:maker-scaffold153_size302544-snap-gene-2.26 protein:Tk03382 transcript:maker-scaffold153_size302544-snap-gene-2.26-mRNA-1 annotation:"hypothetical protein BRAFLDRAFT_120570"
MVQARIGLALVGFSFLLLAGAEESNLKSWFQDISDLKYDCTDFVENSSSEEIFTVVDCGQSGALFSYNYQSMEKSKPKKGPFDGYGIITFPRRGNEHGKFKHGFRTGKCLQLFRRDIRSISGSFREDQLFGRVIVEFMDETVLVGHAVENRLVGLSRYFNVEHHGGFVNVTDISKGESVLTKATSGQYLLHHDGDRMLVTKDFDSFLDCRSFGTMYLQDCFQVNRFKVKRNSCALEIQNVEKEGGSQLKNLYSGQSRSPRVSKDSAHPSCGDGSDNSTQWSGENVRESTEEWIKVMESTDEDPFWTESVVGDALDPENPRIEVELPHLSNRIGLESLPVTIISDGHLLLTTMMINGSIKVELSPTSWKKQRALWENPLTFELKTSILSRYSRGLGPFSTGSSDALQFAVLGRLLNGRLHGPVRAFGSIPSDPKHRCSSKVRGGALSFVGYYSNGKPTGLAWRGLVGGSWIHGEVDDNGEFTGDNVAYIYPDFKTSFLGSFHRGLMVSAQEATVTMEKCQDGLKMFQFSKPEGPKFHYDPPTKDSFGDQPLLGDPLDNRYVYLSQSHEFDIAGEGAFAKEDVPKSTVFVLYGGHILDNEDNQNLQQAQSEELRSLGIEDSKHPSALANWKYRHTLGHCSLVIDIPPEFESTEQYQATLGHKVNHKFVPTTAYMYIDSARFGMVNALITTQDIKKNDEYFANYGYGIKLDLPWFQELYKKFAREHPELVKPEVLEQLGEANANAMGEILPVENY